MKTWNPFKRNDYIRKFRMHVLTRVAGEFEANEWFKNYLKGINKKELYESFSEVLEAVQERPVPDWDR